MLVIQTDTDAEEYGKIFPGVIQLRAPSGLLHAYNYLVSVLPAGTVREPILIT